MWRLILAGWVFFVAVALGLTQGVSTPTGWTAQASAEGTVLTPNNLKPGNFFTVVVMPSASEKGSLEDALEAAYRALGAESQKIGPAEKRSSEGVGMIAAVRVLKQDGKEMLAQVVVVRRGGQDRLMVVLTGDPELLKTYEEATSQILASLIGNAPKAPSAAPSFSYQLPEGWERWTQGTVQVAGVRNTPYGRSDRYLYILAAEPTGGSVTQAFERIWKREMTQGAIKLSEGPSHITPLRRRLPSGLVAWYDGGRGVMGATGYCYANLTLVEAGDHVLPVLSVYAISAIGGSMSDWTPYEEFLRTLRTRPESPKKPLFQMAELAGDYEIFLTASLASYVNSVTGSYMGDASAGGREKLSLKPDGSYSMSFQGKSQTTGISVADTGRWKIEDDRLILTPTRRTEGSGPLRATSYRIFGIVYDGKGWELLLSPGNSDAHPIDSGEFGARMSVATQGAAVLRYRRQ